jgi:hypothetical protein
MTTVMLEGENANVVRKDTVVDGERETRHEIAPDVCLDNAPPVGSLENDKNSPVGGVAASSPRHVAPTGACFPSGASHYKHGAPLELLCFRTLTHNRHIKRARVPLFSLSAH